VPVFDPAVFDSGVFDTGGGGPSTGSLDLTGQQPVVGISLIPSTGSVVITGQTVVVQESGPGSITPTAGSLTLTGNQPILDISLTPNAGSLTLTGNQPTLSNSSNPNITPGTAVADTTGATLQWFSGAESGSITEFNAIAPLGSPSVVTSPVRSGTYALKTPSGADVKMQTRFPSAAADIFVRLYMQMAAFPSVKTRIFDEIDPNDGSQEFKLYVKTDGNLEFDFNATIENTGTTPISLGVWNLIEIHFVRSDTVGGMEVKLNGVTLFTRFNLDTNLGAGAPSNDTFITYGPRDGGGQDMFFDDMAIGTGAYIGPGQCVAVQGKSGTPTYDAWTKVGAADAFGCWSQTPFDATKNCTDMVSGDKQTMLVDGTALTAAIPALSTINGAFVAMVAMCASSTINIQLMRRIGGVDTFTANKILTTSDKFHPGAGFGNGAVMEIFTDSLTHLAAAEIGVQDENSSILATVEDMWLMVDFTQRGGSLNITGYSPALTVSGGSATITPGTGRLGVTGQAASVGSVVPGVLPVVFNVLRPLNQILPVQYNVINGGLHAVLPVTFTVLETLVPLEVTWRVIPNVQTLFDASIQKPTASVDETP